MNRLYFFTVLFSFVQLFPQYLAVCEDGATGYVPFPGNCRLYYQCVKGYGILQACSAGTLFNHEKQQCDLPSQVKCFNSKTNPASLADSNEPDIVDGHYYSSISQEHKPQQRIFKRNTNYYPEANSYNHVRCPDGFSGLLPHPTICKQFLNCDHGRTFIQDCGPGTVFNPALLVCDYPYVVNCKQSSNSVNIHHSAEEVENFGQEFEHSSRWTSAKIEPITEECFGCICEAMTGCQPRCSATRCGVFYIKEKYWREAGSPILSYMNPYDPNNFQTCALDKTCARRTVRNYMEKYQVDCDNDGVIGCRDYGRIHVFGAVGCKSGEYSQSKYLRSLDTCIDINQIS